MSLAKIYGIENSGTIIKNLENVSLENFEAGHFEWMVQMLKAYRQLYNDVSNETILKDFINRTKQAPNESALCLLENVLQDHQTKNA